MIISPYGKVLGELDEKEGTLIVDISVNEADAMRESFRTFDQKRNEMYHFDTNSQEIRETPKGSRWDGE